MVISEVFRNTMVHPLRGRLVASLQRRMPLGDQIMETLDQIRCFAHGGMAWLQRQAIITESSSNPEVRK
jgi:hypothetical protein